MSLNDFMIKIRYWDNLLAKWLMRHFYITFFQIVLVVIFVFWFINTLSVIDTSTQVSPTNLTERILITQSTNITLIVFLMLLNTFWLLFMFNGIQSLKGLLKDITYNTSRIRSRDKSI